MIETAILLSLLPGAVALFLPMERRPQWRRYLPWLGLVLIATHLLMEGYRWQMVPAYVLTFAFLLSSLWARRRTANPPPVPPDSRWHTVLSIAGAIVVLIALGLVMLIPVSMPVFKLPTPSGEFRVGTTSFSLLDASRPETFTADPSDKRELLIKAWYPAELAADAVPEVLWGHPREITRRLTRSLGLPFFLYDHFTLIKTHSYPDALLAGTRPKYSVLLFSHGYDQGIPPQNTVQMEELASHGYVVFSIGHPYESLALIYPDGRTVTVSEEQMKRVHDELRAAGPIGQKLLASHDAAERSELLRQVGEATPVLNKSLAVWVADTAFVLDELAKPQGTAVPRIFAHKLDLARIGVFGMSFGGAAATDFCLTDSRCRAGINLDGLQYGPLAAPGTALNVPFMFMTSESSGLMNEPVFRRARADAWYVTVKGSTHVDYSDFSLVSPLFSALGLLGPINGRRMEQIMNAYIMAFFDQQFAGKDSPLLKGLSNNYPEVTVHFRSGATRRVVRTSPEPER